MSINKNQRRLRLLDPSDQEPLVALGHLKLESLIEETEFLTQELKRHPLNSELVQRTKLFLEEYERRLHHNHSLDAANDVHEMNGQLSDITES